MKNEGYIRKMIDPHLFNQKQQKIKMDHSKFKRVYICEIDIIIWNEINVNNMILLLNFGNY